MALANSRVQYFLPEQEAKVKAFYESVKHNGIIHVNAKGEKLQVMRYWLPFGFITELTVSYPQKDGSIHYHTPLATLESKDGQVSVLVPGEKSGKIMTGAEWLAWLGESYTLESIPDVPLDPQIASQVKNINQLVEMQKANYEELEKQGWVSAADRKKSKKG